MKRCPQCETVYTNETQFCLNDGSILIEETPPEMNFDDNEEATIIRHDPIIVDFGQAKEPVYQTVPTAPNRPTIIVEKQRNTGKYLLFLIVGLILGGALVLAGLLIARTSSREDNTANVKTNNKNQTEKVFISNQIANSNTNANILPSNVSAVEANTVHEEKTSADDADFNGIVITLNAYLRSAPSKNASEISILPKDDRLKIGKRENPNSPWYRVTCEHGESGWMHGNTFEWIDH